MIYVPLVTPFTTDGAVDEASLRRLAHHLLEQGAAGLVPLGTTGEGPLLSPGEQRRVVEICREVSDAHGTPLIVGAGTIGTADTIRHATEHAPYADLLLTVVPYYLRPSDESVLEHFAAVGAAAGVPLLVYNVPYRTGKTLRVETLLKLLSLEHVAGMKHCPGAIDADTLALMAGGRSVYAGDDAFLYPMLRLGAAGGICASANLAPAAYARLVANPSAELHNRLLPLVEAVFSEPSPSVIKAVLAEQGLISTPFVRAPLRLPDGSSVRHALDVLTGLTA